VVNDVDEAALDSLDSWQLSISIDKCCLHIGKSDFDVKLCLDNTLLPVVSSCRNLGIAVSHDLLPSAHINDIVAKAHRRTNAILQSFVCRDVKLLVRAYLRVVCLRPLVVQYNSTTWSPNFKYGIDAV